MIKVIAKHLATPPSDLMDFTYIAEGILTAYELAGMLPPPKCSKEFGVTGTLDEHGRMHFAFNWEPEDE